MRADPADVALAPGAPGTSHLPAPGAPGTAHLLAADPDVPGLALLLDDATLGAWLADRLGPSRASGETGASGASGASCAPGAPGPGVRRRYVRLKPGAGGVARVDRGAGTEPAYLVVVAHEAAAKLAKTLSRAGEDVIVEDREALAVLAGPGADRDLPGLVRLHRRGSAAALRGLHPVDDPARRLLRRAALGGTGTRTLAWKPQRRWVGLVRPDVRPDVHPDVHPAGEAGADPAVVLRAYRRSALPQALTGYRTLAALAPGAVPRVLGHDVERGLLAVEHLQGVTLDRVVGRALDAALLEAGRVLGSVHAAGAGGAAAGARDVRRDEVRSVRDAADLVDRLAPGAGAVELAGRVAHALRVLPASEPVVVHGDLSDDQMVLRPDGRVGLLDLDEAGRGPAVLDLASAAAAWWVQDPGSAPTRTAALHRGYADVRALPGPDELRVRTAALVLRRAAEPFRHGEPGWPGLVRRRVRAAAVLLAGGTPP